MPDMLAQVVYCVRNAPAGRELAFGPTRMRALGVQIRGRQSIQDRIHRGQRPFGPGLHDGSVVIRGIELVSALVAGDAIPGDLPGGVLGLAHQVDR